MIAPSGRSELRRAEYGACLVRQTVVGPDMRKMITRGVLVAAAVAATAAAGASPTFADNDSNFGGGVNAANNWNFTAAAVCLQEVAVVPVLGDYIADHTNNCSNGNVIDHAAQAAGKTVNDLTGH